MNRCTIRISKQRSSHNSHRRPLIERAFPRSPGLDSRPGAKETKAGDEGADTEGRGKGKGQKRKLKIVRAVGISKLRTPLTTTRVVIGLKLGGGGSNQRIGKLYG